MKAATVETKTARVRSIGGTYAKGVVVAELSDGSSIRVLSRDTGLTPGCSLDIGVLISYDVDAAGNRFNPRLAGEGRANG